jgi:hypothetical protein
MVIHRFAGLVGAASVALCIALTGCGKKDAPVEKSAEQLTSERGASAAKARESAVFGGQLQAMDKAKSTVDEASKAAEERAKKAADQ